MNKKFAEYGVEYDKLDKSTWPYYLNICGKPHSANTTITMTSMDTNEIFEVTRDTLLEHPRTHAKLLEFGTLFDTLTSMYTGQEVYIRGLIADVTYEDLDTFDGDILHYNKDLVEENEVNLISSLSFVSGRFLSRWVNREYLLTDNLYAPAVYATYVSFLTKQLLSMRLKNITTNEVHTYYQDMILASNFNIVEHKEVLNKASTLWLVKNIKSLGYHIGSHETMDKVIRKVLSPSGFTVEVINVSNREDKDDTLTLEDYISKDVESTELLTFLPSLIYEDNLTEQYRSGTVRYKQILDELTRVRGISEKTKVMIISLRSFVSDIEITNPEIIQKAILKTLFQDEAEYLIDTTYGRILMTNRELYYSTLIAFFKLYQIDGYESVKNVSIDNIFIKTDVDTSTLTTDEERQEKLDAIHDAIDLILDSNANNVEKQILCKTLINYESSNTNNEILTHEIELLRKEIVEEILLEVDMTLGEYQDTDRLFDNDTRDTLVQVYKLFGIEFDATHNIITKLTNASSLFNKLTSYTITSVIDSNIVDGNCEIEPNMTLEGETIIKVTDVTSYCQGAVADVEAFGGEMLDTLSIVGTDVLEEVETRVLEPDISVVQEMEDDYLKVVRPRLK